MRGGGGGRQAGWESFGPLSQRRLTRSGEEWRLRGEESERGVGVMVRRGGKFRVWSSEPTGGRKVGVRTGEEGKVLRRRRMTSETFGRDFTEFLQHVIFYFIFYILLQNKMFDYRQRTKRRRRVPMENTVP